MEPFSSTAAGTRVIAHSSGTHVKVVAIVALSVISRIRNLEQHLTTGVRPSAEIPAHPATRRVCSSAQ